MDRQKLKGEFYILLAALIWGSAFVVQKVGMDYIGPLTFTAFLVAQIPEMRSSGK